MPSDSFGTVCLGILPNRMLFALSPYRRNLGVEGVSTKLRATSHHNEFLSCFGRQRTQRLVSSVLQDQSDRRPQIILGIRYELPLARWRQEPQRNRQ